MPRTRQNAPLISYDENVLFSTTEQVQEETLDEWYGRKPVDCSVWPQKAPVWFKNDNTLNWNAGKVVVQALGWLVQQFQEDPDLENESFEWEGESHWIGEDEDEQPETLLDIKSAIQFMKEEWEDGDIVSYCEDKMSEFEDRDDHRDGEEPLFSRLLNIYEDVLGCCESILEAHRFDDQMTRDLRCLLDMFCDAYQLQYIKM